MKPISNYQKQSQGDYIDYQDKLCQLLYNQQIVEGSIIKNPNSDNEYELIKEIGQGEFGVVYEAKQLNSYKKENVAIKIAIKSQDGEDNSAYECFQKEEQIQQQVKNENIVNIYEAFETQNKTFIVMEKCDFDLLEEMQFDKTTKESKKYSIQKSIDYLAQILNAFKSIQQYFKQKYGQDVAHRDLKPSNIMLKDGILKLTDFGTAKVIKEGGQQNFQSYVGTCLWMAPEIMKMESGEIYSNKCDIFSIAIIFYQLIYGQVPFNANSQYKILQKIEKQNIYYDSQDPKLQQANNLLKKMFIPNNQERVGWDILYQHPYFIDRQLRKGIIQQFQNSDKFFRDYPQEVKEDLQNYYLCNQQFLEQIHKLKGNVLSLNNCCQKIIKQLTEQYIFFDDKLLGLFLIYKYNSLNLNDTKKLWRSCKGKSIGQMDKLSNQYIKRKNKEFVKDINDTFYDSEMVYCLENNVMGKQCQHYLLQYYSIMTDVCCQYKLFDKNDMKKFSESLLTFEEVQEKYRQKLERKQKQEEQRAKEKEKLKQRAQKPLYFNPYAQRDEFLEEDQEEEEQEQQEQQQKEQNSLQSGNILIEQSKIMMEQTNKQDLGFEIIIDVNDKEDSKLQKSKENDMKYRQAKSFSYNNTNDINEFFNNDNGNNDNFNDIINNLGSNNIIQQQQQQQRSQTFADQMFEQFQLQQKNKQQKEEDEQETQWENSQIPKKIQSESVPYQELESINLGDNENDQNNNQ